MKRRTVLAGLSAFAISRQGQTQERMPSLVQDGKTIIFVEPMALAPYVAGAGSDLAKVAEELDVIFAKIASDASKAGP